MPDSSAHSDRRQAPDFLALPYADLVRVVGGSGRAESVWKALRGGLDPLDETAGAVSAPTHRALQVYLGGAHRLPAVAEETAVPDGTVKLLVRMADGLAVECVVIPHARLGRTTVCVSSQVGCARGCLFCATGQMGLLRSLTADEILAQVVAAEKWVLTPFSALPPLRNVVFMGMGEPLDNAAAVRAAVAALIDPRRFGFAKRKVMVSTLGPSPEAFREFEQIPAIIAWSLHAADDGLRRQLVPNARHTTAALREALIAVIAHRPAHMRVLMIEITLIEGVNDRPGDADALAEFLQPLYGVAPKICVDLIPFNPVPERPEYRRSPRDRVVAFQQRLRDRNVFCSVRITRGATASASCGQLVTKRCGDVR